MRTAASHSLGLGAPSLSLSPAEHVSSCDSYPGGKLFDPFGFSRGSPAKLDEYKVKEIKNGRLAILVRLLALVSAIIWLSRPCKMLEKMRVVGTYNPHNLCPAGKSRFCSPVCCHKDGPHHQPCTALEGKQRMED